MSQPDGAAAFDALVAHRGRDVLVLLDESLRIVRAGAEAGTLADRPPTTLVGMSLIAAFGSASLDSLARRALGTGAPLEGDVELGHLDARAFTVDAIPLGSAGLVLALHDVTTLRRIERVRRDFVANISHELRTPLTSVKLLAETIASGSVDDPDTLREFATQIEREADHLTQMVDELLDLSTIESGDLHLAMEALDPDEVVATCVERIQPVAERRDIRVTGETGNAKGVRARADPSRLGQALLNLAHNGVKFSHPGGELRIGWVADDQAVRFTVADDGVGIPATHHTRIFERFYKVDRSRTRDEERDGTGGSSGLGLAIVRHIADAHGGSAGMTTEEGVGSTFWIEVPRETF